MGCTSTHHRHADPVPRESQDEVTCVQQGIDSPEAANASKYCVAKQVDGFPEVVLKSAPGVEQVVAKVPNGEQLKILRHDKFQNVKVQWKHVQGWAKATNVVLKSPPLPADFDEQMQKSTSPADFTAPLGSKETILTYLLQSHAFLYLSTQWLASQASGTSPLPRRQDLSALAFLRLEDMISLGSDPFIIVFSYGWIQRGHPDPKRWYLEALSHMFKLFLDSMEELLAWEGDGRYRTKLQRTPIEAVADMAFFWDFFSLEQCWVKGGIFENRTHEQQRRFDGALKNMHVIYGHVGHVVWRFNFLPVGILPKVEDRGWPYFEMAIFTTTVKRPPPAERLEEHVEVPEDAHSRTAEEAVVFKYSAVQMYSDRCGILAAKDWNVLNDMQGNVLCAPIHPKHFSSELDGKVFTGNGDKNRVQQLYRDIYNNCLTKQKTFPWRPSMFASAEALAEFFSEFTLPEFNMQRRQPHGYDDRVLFGKVPHINFINTVDEIYMWEPALQSHPTLQVLNVLGSPSTEALSTMLGRVLRHNTVLQILNLGPLGYHEDISQLAVGLQHNTALHTLTFRGLGLGDANVSALCHALRYNSTLRALDLSDNDCHDASALCHALRYNSTLRVLDLSGSRFLDASPFALALQHNTTLEHLFLQGVKVDTSLFSDVAATRVNFSSRSPELQEWFRHTKRLECESKEGPWHRTD